MFDKYVIRYDQMQPSGYAWMVSTFVSDLWGCQAKIAKIHVLKNKIMFNHVFHMIKTCCQVWEASQSPIGCSNKCGVILGILTNYRHANSHIVLAKIDLYKTNW